MDSGVGRWQDIQGSFEDPWREVCGPSIQDNIVVVATAFGVRQSWGQILALLFSRYMILAKFISLGRASDSSV